MIISTSKTEHTLEIFGPRGIAWRPAASTHGDLLKEPIALAYLGRIPEAISRSEDLWIERHGNMHNIGFRVRSTVETISGTSIKDVMPENRLDF